jgi:hypothetical protein
LLGVDRKPLYVLDILIFDDEAKRGIKEVEAFYERKNIRIGKNI